MYITHKVNIDLAFAGPSNTPPIKVMQGDDCSRYIAVTLKSNGADWAVPEGVSVCVGYQKSDDTGGIYDTLPEGTKAWSIAGSVVTVAIAPQVLTVPGDVQLAVSLISSGTVLSTFPVTIHVEALPGFGGTSEDYVNLNNILPGVTEADNEKILQVVDGVWKPTPKAAAVIYNAAQTLTNTQKERARTNIGAISASQGVMLAEGTSISRNTDLNTMTTYGNYKCTSASTVATLVNCPVTGAFIMRVGSPAPGVANYYYQEIMMLNGTRYYRYGYPSSGSLAWTSWRQTFDTVKVIPARYGGMGADTSSDLGEAEHLACCQRFVDEMNKNAAVIGMSNSKFETPSGLCRKPIHEENAPYHTRYNSHTTAYDVLRLLIAARHTPTVLAAMGAETCSYWKNGTSYWTVTGTAGNTHWKNWAEGHGYTILGAKGGSLNGEYGEIGAGGINNIAALIQDASGDIFAVAVLGLQSPIQWNASVTYAKDDRVTVDGITYVSLADSNRNNAVTDTAYWAETASEISIMRTLLHDLISMVGGGAETAAIHEVNHRRYPVCMAAAKLTASGNFADDIAALSGGVFYHGDTVRVAASVTKVLNAITAVPYLGNHHCSVNFDDLVGGSGLTFAQGDAVVSCDALNLMLAISDNAMATLVARDCGRRMRNKDVLPVGQSTTGTEYTINDVTVTAAEGAEIFNNYAENIACGYDSHAEGDRTTASGYGSHAEGLLATASGNYAHAEGYHTIASNHSSHAEGYHTTASGNESHAEGSDTIARGRVSHAEGVNTIAYSNHQHVQGKYNIQDTSHSYAHIVGNGESDTNRSNAHTVDWSGNAVFAGTVSGTGADYAEHFEWLDGNPDGEDRVGLIVTLEGDKVRLANADDEMLGIVSGTAMVIGDNAEWEWQGKFLTDDYGRVIVDMVEEFMEIKNPETGETEQQSVGIFPHRKLNPEWDMTLEYTSRAVRPEWDVVGLLGKLYVNDDGTCVAGGYATNADNGVATASAEQTNMRVMKRVTDNIVMVFMK